MDIQYRVSQGDPEKQHHRTNVSEVSESHLACPILCDPMGYTVHGIL